MSKPDAPKLERFAHVSYTFAGESGTELRRDEDGEWVRYSDLRPLLERVAGASFLAGMSAQQFVTGTYGVHEDELESEATIIARALDEQEGK